MLNFLNFSDYKESEGMSVSCDFDKRPRPGEVCKVDINNFGPCSQNVDYGYNSSSPCVFLKLNRVSN